MQTPTPSLTRRDTGRDDGRDDGRDVSPTLRRPRADDAPALAELLGHPGVQPWLLQLPFTSEAFWRERLGKTPDVQSGELQLLAFDGDRLLGSAGLHLVGPQARRRHAMALGIGVHPDAQGTGVGTALMSALIQQADDWLGTLRIELTVFADNLRAIRLYERFGFVHEGRLRAYALRSGRYVDCLSMARLHPHPPRWD
ncbi:GNAT family N-acetyltransferase [Roseateles amylovorans]|uniref:GNAT family N-acetyltransferase n=1 Tax=Roseateles amylovorans TaxID=2978473 RepID=A0ABY6B4I4_9BURK|nr:GNAT family N-acetyltransferase [Roseateles amylovorans]UXH79757.1 GNAT family N-acetyltransferase [Roseateles amylovorans]